MKKIIFYQEKNEPIIIIDDNDDDISIYTSNLTKLMQSSKLCIVESTSGNILIKPSKINSIFITELIDKEINNKLKSNDVIKD